MSFLTRVLSSFLFLACFALTGCIESKQPLFNKSTATTPLPPNAIAISDDNSSTMTAVRAGPGAVYAAKTMLFPNLSVTFHPVPSLARTYIVQGKTKDRKHVYFVAKIDRYFSYASFEAVKRVAAAARIKGITNYKKKGVIADSRTALFNLARALSKSGPGAFSVRHRLFNRDDPTEQAKANRRLAAIKTKSKQQKQRNNQAKQQRRAAAKKVTKAGKWIFKAKIDQITDEKKQFAFGVPIQADGVQQQPYLRIGCYNRDMGATLYWGTTLADLYPQGKMDAVRVIVRFGKTDPLHMGWAVSSDFTSTFAPGPAGALTGLSDSLLSAVVPGRKPVNFGWNAAKLNAIMRKASEVGLDMIVRAENRRGGDATLVFDLDGYSKVTRANFRRHCLADTKKKKRTR